DRESLHKFDIIIPDIKILPKKICLCSNKLDSLNQSVYFESAYDDLANSQKYDYVISVDHEGHHVPNMEVNDTITDIHNSYFSVTRYDLGTFSKLNEGDLIGNVSSVLCAETDKYSKANLTGNLTIPDIGHDNSIILGNKIMFLDQTILIDETSADIPPNIDLSQTLGNIIKLHETHVDMRLPTELDRTGLFEDVESELRDKWTYNDLVAEVSIGIEDSDIRKRFEDLIFEYREIFSSVDFTKGKNLPEFHIELLNNVPIFSPQIRTSPATNLEILKITEDLEKKGIISKSNSDYNIPALFVRRRPTPDTTSNKPVSALRMILDLRQIGEHSVKHKWQIAPMEETLKKLSNFKHYLSLKLINYNFQVPLSKESTNILAFTAGAGRFQLNKLPFGAYLPTSNNF
ncbi:unnamed protein product, partial [Rotaria socialis]